MGPKTSRIPATDRSSQALHPPLIWALACALVVPLACIGGQGDSTTSASSTTASGSSESLGMTSTSGKTTSAGTGTGTDGTQGATTETQGTTDTQGTATDPTDTGTTTCSFLECTDTPPPHENCDYQDALCPEGSKCSFDDELWQTSCFDLDPMPADVGEPCEGSGVPFGGQDNCGDKAVCWDDTCLALCDYDDYACPSGYSCTTCQDCALGICTPVCDPLINDCPGDDLCLPSGESFICVLDASGEMGAYGDPCEYANACDPGLYCLSPEYVPGCDAAGCCSPWCDVGDPTCPDELQECIPWFDEGQAPRGYEDLGICGLPQP